MRHPDNMLLGCAGARQRAFRADLAVINECLDGLIARAKRTRQVDDAEALQARDYSKVGVLAASST